ncbi:MAG TPA: DUF4189 domain-containing protein [Rhodanobacter sp.]
MRYLLIYLCLLYLLGSVAHAEGNCPLGQYPIGTPQGQAGPQGCAPIPGYNNQNQQQAQPPPPQWADRWGSIVTDTPKGILGTAHDLPSQDQAKNVALEDCQSKGGLQCKMQIAYKNECAVMIMGDKGFNIASGVTMNAAIQAGMKICGADGDPGCHVYYSACSLPVQIQ